MWAFTTMKIWHQLNSRIDLFSATQNTITCNISTMSFTRLPFGISSYSNHTSQNPGCQKAAIKRTELETWWQALNAKMPFTCFSSKVQQPLKKFTSQPTRTKLLDILLPVVEAKVIWGCVCRLKMDWNFDFIALSSKTKPTKGRANVHFNN